MAKSHDLIDLIHDRGVDTKNREIYLFGELDAKLASGDEEPGVEFLMANRLVKNMRLLSNISQEPIVVHLKTNGGYFEEGMAIYDMVRFCPCRVTMLSYTHARSMSSIILQAADHRVLMPNSHFMFHQGDLHITGTWKQTMTTAEWEKKTNDAMLDIYAFRMKASEHGKFRKWSLERIKNMLQEEMDKKEDVFLTAEETVKWGLADTVFDGWDSLKK